MITENATHPPEKKSKFIESNRIEYLLVKEQNPNSHQNDEEKKKFRKKKPTKCEVDHLNGTDVNRNPDVICDISYTFDTHGRISEEKSIFYRMPLLSWH